MSASPAAPAGATPNGINNTGNTLPPKRRPRPKTNPLVKKQVHRKPEPRPLPSGNASNSFSNGPRADAPTPKRSMNSPKPSQAGTVAADKPAEADKAPDQGEYKDYPLVTTKKSLLEGLRHHAMRLASKKPVNVANEAEFTRPVRLHRRDPRAGPLGFNNAGIVETETKEDLVDDKERERQEAIKAERQAIREANQAQIAPTAKATTKTPAFKKKTEQVFRTDDSPEARKRSQLRYEEALPWHLEDFDNKNTWVGTYEAAMSECHVMLVIEEQGFRMVPLERWYKFTAKSNVKYVSIEEAEERMNKKYKEPRWVLEAQKQNEDRRMQERIQAKSKRLYTRSGGRDDDDQPMKGAGGGGDEERPEVAADADDIDYNLEDDFADDEVDAVLGGDDEEVKVAEEKIKREQLGANLFGVNQDVDYDAEEEQQKNEDRLKKRQEKGLRKALMKMEKNFAYEDESESNPYTSSESDSDDSETERLKEEERKKEEEQKGTERAKGKDGENFPSGASSKGTNTPSGRPKHSDLSRKSSFAVKRPGSPNLSDASGTETSRKKHKKQHLHPTAAANSASSSPPNITSATLNSKSATKKDPGGLSPGSGPGSAPVSRPGSPPADSLNRKQSMTLLKLSASSQKANRGLEGSGSGSDTDAAGEVTDQERRARRLRLTMSPPGGRSPNGPRASSPAASPGAQSNGGGGSTSPPVRLHPPTFEEISARIPPEGILLPALIKIFKPRISDRDEFIGMVKKANVRYNKESKMLFPKDSGNGASGSGNSMGGSTNGSAVNGANANANATNGTGSGSMNGGRG